MGILILLKLIAAAFVTPALLLLTRVPRLMCVHQAVHRVQRISTSLIMNTEATIVGTDELRRGILNINLDSEVAGLLMYMEFGLAFGEALCMHG